MKRFIDGLWCLALMVYVMAGVALAPLHGDEATLIYMSNDYAYQFIERDLSKIYYDPTPADNPLPAFATQQELRLLNGTIPKYLMGFAWHVAGFTPDQLNDQWLWGADYAYNLSSGHIPTDELLYVIRAACALLLALSVVVAFAIGYSLYRRPAAYAFSVLLATNPAILLNGRRAMMESSLLLFSLLAVLAAIYFYHHWRWFIVFGAAVGMAMASKHTAIMMAVPVGGALLMMFAVRTWRTKRWPIRDLGLLIASAIAAVLVFYALNPAWWGDPLGRARYVLDVRAMLLEGQTNKYSTYGSFGDQLNGFWEQTFVGAPQYYESEEWGTFAPVLEDIAVYEASPLRGLGGSVVTGVIFAALTVIGAGRLIRRETLKQGARWIILLWAGGASALVLLATPLEWQRYYLPALVPLLAVASVGAAWGFEALKSRIGLNRLSGANQPQQ